MSESSAGGDSGVVTERLLWLYRRYLGEPERLSDVYAGFGLFFAGIALGAVGMGVFLWSAALPPGSELFWPLRELAISLSMLGLPSFLLGVGVLLPFDRRALAVGGAGGAVCLLAVGVFVTNYPRNWNAPGPDATALGVSVYALGVVLVSAAVGAALVSNYIARSTPAAADAAPAAGEGVEGGTGDATGAESVSEDEVRADIDEALSGTELSWGGVERDDTRRIEFRVDEEDAGGIDGTGLDGAAAESRTEGSEVDDAVAELGKLRGGERTEATGEGTDDQAAALQQLRQQRAEQDEEDGGVFGSLRERLGL